MCFKVTYHKNDKEKSLNLKRKNFGKGLGAQCFKQFVERDYVNGLKNFNDRMETYNERKFWRKACLLYLQSIEKNEEQGNENAKKNEDLSEEMNKELNAKIVGERNNQIENQKKKNQNESLNDVQSEKVEDLIHALNELLHEQVEPK